MKIMQMTSRIALRRNVWCKVPVEQMAMTAQQLPAAGEAAEQQLASAELS